MGIEQALELGDGVVLAVLRAQSRVEGSASSVQQRGAYVYQWVDGVVARATVYTDVDEARAVAEGPAESRR